MNFQKFSFFIFLTFFIFFDKFLQIQSQQQQQATAIDALGTRGVAPSSDIALNCAGMAEYCQDKHLPRVHATLLRNDVRQRGPTDVRGRLGHL
ncbi:hypothetical protein niasHT_030901 [Heterodera trifolii]|uniref:Uncharacterized protein n=1 Tax=Heterodera trifolii TaxID=157864 RepID=A0ABD2HV44_9BILA